MDRYISRLFDCNAYPFLNDNDGSAEIYPSAHIDLPTFLDKSREYFKSECLLLEERFDFSQFDPNQGAYKSLQSDRVIFCEGFRVKDNPYFKSLPLSPTKGEVMTIHIPSLDYFDKIISKGVYILPLGNHLYVVGATYNHTDLTDELTTEGQSFLRDKVNEILSVEYEVISSVAGVRPTVSDRKPLIGLHPNYNKIGVFNGLGTRGALQGPSLSAEFSAVLVANQKNTQNIDNQRFMSFFSSFK
jgi:glycine/D-amino acid oxidase-like deaminating enzyme